MREIITKICIALFVLMFSSKTQSQEVFKWMPKDVTVRSEKVTSFMADRLNLDEVQAQKLQKINLKYAGLMQPILESDSSPLEKYLEAEKMIFARIEETKMILNKNQLANIEERKNRWQPLIESVLQFWLD